MLNHVKTKIYLNMISIPIQDPSDVQIPNILRTSHLNDKEQKQLLKLCEEFQDILKLTFTNTVKHEIKTIDEEKVYIKAYYVHKKEVRKQINIIPLSSSPRSCPIWK